MKETANLVDLVVSLEFLSGSGRPKVSWPKNLIKMMVLPLFSSLGGLRCYIYIHTHIYMHTICSQKAISPLFPKMSIIIIAIFFFYKQTTL